MAVNKVTITSSSTKCGKISFNFYIKPNCTTVEIQCNSNSHKSLNKNLINVILILQSFAEALELSCLK